jgi:SAM-dependent methyltransferase
MRPRLLEFLVCSSCHGTLNVDVFERAGAADDEEVLAGALRCRRCSAAFPVIRGVPRMLSGALLAQMIPRYPEFFSAHPEFAPETPVHDGVLADTLDSFTRQQLDFEPPGAAVAHQWRENLARNLGGALSLDALRGKTVLDVGCGFGRHMYVAHERGAEVVGVDLSGGVDRAWQNTARNPRCHVVQANIFDAPFRTGVFEVVWSFGVLHHMRVPRDGFRALVPFAKPDEGLVVIWVYGYRGMALTYRLSHMRPLHRITCGMSPDSRVRASKSVAALLSAAYWEPLRLARRLGLGRAVERLPLSAYVEHGWLARVAAVHDRLSPPITHFHDRDELAEWFVSARLHDIVVEDTQRRGWRAHGHRVADAGERLA